MHLKEDLQTLIEKIQPGTSRITMRKNVFIPKLVAALDMCQLSMKDSVFIPEATIEALGYNTDEFPVKQLIAVPKLESSSGSRQAQAVWNAIVDWNLEDEVQYFL
ncbi:hypothetical protein J437_LFUL014425 [Ladona fulva]|uniref:Uncharacterized protein n=1 Tax=Ladona fulva TaxID=123851 RepID=A0A8K0KMS2_LADFU|nr:hypothetical protein J437_LFUL014425 [Ladona fulva]